MAEFLSERWFEALAAALTALPSLPAEPGAPPLPSPTGHATPQGGLAVGQIVTKVPEHAGAAGAADGVVRYTIVLHANGPASLVRGSTAQADVTLLEDWSTAEAIATGSASVPEMLSAGKIKLHGDTRALVAAGDFLAGIAHLVAANLGGAGPAR